MCDYAIRIPVNLSDICACFRFETLERLNTGRGGQGSLEVFLRQWRRIVGDCVLPQPADNQAMESYTPMVRLSNHAFQLVSGLTGSHSVKLSG